MRSGWVGGCLAVVALAACFSKPGLRLGEDGGPNDAPTDGTEDDAPIDAACMPAADPPPPQLVQLTLSTITAGESHVCGIDTATALWCWGSNDHGQLGERTDSPGMMTGTPGVASSMMGWTDVAASSDHTCGIKGGNVYCWGRNDAHQSAPFDNSGTDVGITQVSFTALALPTSEVPTKLFMGPTVSCVITGANRAICWGKLSLTVTGASTQNPTLLVATNGISSWASLALAEDHACALSGAGNAYCWGKNDHLQLGAPGVDRGFLELAPRDTTTAFNSIAVAPMATCATKTTGELVCWGYPNLGHLGTHDSTDDDDHPIASGTWTQVALGADHVCATDQNGTSCYGDNTDGALGDGQFQAQRSIVGPTVTGAHQIVTGTKFSCSLDSSLHATCWGTNAHGELGLGAIATKDTPSLAPLPVGTCESVLQVVAGDRHTCALVGTPGAGRAYCWGNNQFRQVTSPASPAIAAPTQVFPTELFTRLAAGERHTCGLRADGNIRCWGNNDDSQLAGPSPSLIAPIGGSAWTYVAAGSRATCAIQQTGKLYCWGNVPVLGGKSTPFDAGLVLGTRQWTSVALGSGFGIGTAIDPTVPTRPYIYGFAPTGCQLDDPTGSTTGTPVTPHELFNVEHTHVNVAAAQANGGHLCFHQQNANGDNKITCVGRNADHQSGDEQGASACVPYDDPDPPPLGWRQAFPGVATVAISGSHSCALDAMGQPWCWGANFAHELGSIASPAIDPTRVNDTRFAEITTGAEHTCGIDEARRQVLCWGKNRDGQLGDASRFHPAPTPAGLVPP